MWGNIDAATSSVKVNVATLALSVNNTKNPKFFERNETVARISAEEPRLIAFIKE